jgi:CheY-like chemotaxis protein
MEPRGFGRKRILVAEDNRADVFLVREALSESGIDYELEVVEDGESAILFLDRIDSDLKEDPPDLFLVDLNLPRSDGVSVLSHVRKSERCKDIPIVVMTSSELSESERAALGPEGTAYFRKPTQLDEFLKLGNLVHTLLGSPPTPDHEKTR